MKSQKTYEIYTQFFSKYTIGKLQTRCCRKKHIEEFSNSDSKNDLLISKFNSNEKITVQNNLIRFTK